MDTGSPAFLVQGFFFQDKEYLGIAMRPIEGAVAVINRGMTRSMFSGLIVRDHAWDDLTGTMDDYVGSSLIGSVSLSDEEFRFTKQYERRGDRIDYVFHREDGFWLGNWSGELVGEGTASCVLTPIPEKMLYGPHG